MEEETNQEDCTDETCNCNKEVGPINFVLPPSNKDTTSFIENCSGQVAHLHGIASKLYKKYDLSKTIPFETFFSIAVVFFLTGHNTTIYEILDNQENNLTDTVDEVLKAIDEK